MFHAVIYQMQIPTPIKLRNAETVTAANDVEFQMLEGSTGSLATLYSHMTKRAKCARETIRRA